MHNAAGVFVHRLIHQMQEGETLSQLFQQRGPQSTIICWIGKCLADFLVHTFVNLSAPLSNYGLFKNLAFGTEAIFTIAIFQ